MRLTHFFIDRPIFATVLSALVTLVGLGALVVLPIAQYPEIVPPTVQITTIYPGASAETVARREHYVKMQGREVFRFATRVMPDSVLLPDGKVLVLLGANFGRSGGFMIHFGRSWGATNAANEAADKNRDAAIVRIPASHGLAALDVPLVHETMGWRLDIPDSVDSAKLKANIQSALTDIGEMKAQWAADPDEAYRAATHRVLLGIFDKPAKEEGAGAGAGAGTGATDTTAAPGAAK